MGQVLVKLVQEVPNTTWDEGQSGMSSRSSERAKFEVNLGR